MNITKVKKLKTGLSLTRFLYDSCITFVLSVLTVERNGYAIGAILFIMLLILNITPNIIKVEQ